MPSGTARRGSTYPGKSGVLVAHVGLADVPAVVRLGFSRIEWKDAVVKVALDVEQTLIVKGHQLGIRVARVKERDGDIGDRVGGQAESGRVALTGGGKEPGEDACVADSAVGRGGISRSVEVVDVCGAQFLITEAEAFDGSAFVAGRQSAAIESLVGCRFDDKMERLRGDVVEWLLGIDNTRNGAEESEDGGLHVCCAVGSRVCGAI